MEYDPTVSKTANPLLPLDWQVPRLKSHPHVYSHYPLVKEERGKISVSVDIKISLRDTSMNAGERQTAMTANLFLKLKLHLCRDERNRRWQTWVKKTHSQWYSWRWWLHLNLLAKRRVRDGKKEKSLCICGAYRIRRHQVTMASSLT